MISWGPDSGRFVHPPVSEPGRAGRPARSGRRDCGFDTAGTGRYALFAQVGQPETGMDVAELAARTDVPVRRLRYAIDHRVLPGMRHAAPGHGVPRTFTEF